MIEFNLANCAGDRRNPADRIPADLRETLHGGSTVGPEGCLGFNSGSPKNAPGQQLEDHQQLARAGRTGSMG